MKKTVWAFIISVLIGGVLSCNKELSQADVNAMNALLEVKINDQILSAADGVDTIGVSNGDVVMEVTFQNDILLLSTLQNNVVLREKGATETLALYFVQSESKVIVTSKQPLSLNKVYKVEVSALQSDSSAFEKNDTYDFILKPEGASIAIFDFNASNNKVLSSNVSGIIKESTITLEVPKGVDIKSLTPSIIFSGKSLSPVSEETTDFTSPVIYTVSGLETTKTYTVTVTERPDVALSGGRVTLAYFPTWSESWAGAGQESKLRNIPSFVNTIFLAFAKPDMQYTKGSFSLQGTGIQVPYDGASLKESITALKNKGITVILSLGGENYWRDDTRKWYDALNYQAIKDFLDDFGIDGIDWDYEPNGQISALGNAFHVEMFVQMITESRKILPKGQYIIAAAPSGVGALSSDREAPSGPHQDQNALTESFNQHSPVYDFGPISNPTTAIGILHGFSSTGHFIPVMEQVGEQLDMIAYQGYNCAGTTDRTVMYDAYKYYAEKYNYTIVAGTHVPPEPWGPYYTYTHQTVANLAVHIRDAQPSTTSVRTEVKDGIMVWEYLRKDANSSGSSFMWVADQILNAGTSSVNAVAQAASHLNGEDTYTGGGETPSDEGETAPPTSGTHCGFKVWNASVVYNNGGTKVYYKGKIWQNQWYANAGETPPITIPANTWDNVWLYVQECAE